MEFFKRALNVQGGIAVAMVLALYMEWFDTSYQSQWNAKHTPFYVAKDAGLLWLPIICVFIILIIVLVMQKNSVKDMIIGCLSMVIIVSTVICKFFCLPSMYAHTKMGFYVIILLSIVQMVIMYMSNTQKINEMLANRISKI